MRSRWAFRGTSELVIVSPRAAFHQAMWAADVKALLAVLDESFIWTHPAGERMPRPELLDQIGTGKLRFSILVGGGTSIHSTDPLSMRGMRAASAAAMSQASSLAVRDLG